MKSLAKMSLTALCLATLTACSSGGKGDDDSKVVSPNRVGTPTAVQANGNTQAQSGNASSNQAANQNAAVASTGIQQGTLSPTTLVVDGTSYNLAPVGVSAREIHSFGANVELVREVEDNGQYFGFTSKGTGTQRYAYAGSLVPETQNMPTQGIVRYEGDVVYSYGGPMRDGDAELMANFGTKTLSGVFENSHYGNVAVNATINGSAFNGQAVAQGVAPATLSGKFYGVNANGIAGVFGNADNTLGGAFGADRE
ncbi:hypothetical protein RO21_01820 [[Actinobacillus] muris]|uniref:Transferrin-binding protein B C-lobe/N-lobe beta-barrel domain-containing protein n=1 Tax=Muribacter muris TaxID=67855 RepID=A0A0J5P7K9_9PAST|nr:Slam-dependent surface lipoprotein [Muribacter muris]KMK52226.1 hypothetical protein RO21_01820 [[Actinobacillus] muris] [Muribacter muris]